MIYLDLLICLVTVLAAVGAMRSRNLVSAAVMVGAVSLMVSYLFVRMSAPDVAMTEAAIGAGLSTLIFLIAIRRTGEDEG
ncbi:MAG: hydrogenase subunit MbhD domain-containing protein [Candidatus Krumholzibacteriota bacterium]